MINIDLRSKSALVCGASSGIGLAVAQVFAKAGAQVTLVARNEEALKLAVATLHDASKHSYLVADFSSLDSIENLIAEIKKSNIQYQILVNNSGGPKPGTALESIPEEYLDAMTSHLIAASLLAKALVPGMKSANYGRVINIVSISGKVPSDNLASSSATRAAVLSWAKILSNELASSGITVNNVLPGYTQTQRLAEVIQARANKLSTSESSIAESISNKIPMKRFASAEEIAAAVLFFASPMASYVTGTSLPVDGGSVPVV